MSAELKLLVVDWDFFFPNPAMRAEPGPDSLMYLWDHREAPFYLSAVCWGGRASAFLRHGMELPRCEGYEGFWDRFRFNEDGVSVLYGDSNLHAGNILPSSLGLDEEYGVNHWHTVSLWDAHHDSGYNKTRSYEEWKKTGRVSCEDWMLVHYGHGSRLEVTYPAWRQAVGRVEPEPLVPVDRRVDDGTNPDVWYDAVYVCRSGAWVPPWCDDQFSEFLAAGPDSYPTLVEWEGWEHPRPDGLDIARNDVAARERLDQLMGLDGRIDKEALERWQAGREQ
jgi:hypothetical protein